MSEMYSAKRVVCHGFMVTFPLKVNPAWKDLYSLEFIAGGANEGLQFDALRCHKHIDTPTNSGLLKATLPEAWSLHRYNTSWYDSFLRSPDSAATRHARARVNDTCRSRHRPASSSHPMKEGLLRISFHLP
jgi:hypothetical protein